jgi:hypothetical protein
MANEKEKSPGIFARNNVLDRLMQKCVSRKLFVTLAALGIFLTPWIVALFSKGSITIPQILTEDNLTLILLVFIGAQSAQDIVALISANKGGGGGSALSSFFSSAKKSGGQPTADPILSDGDPTVAVTPPPADEEEGA